MVAGMGCFLEDKEIYLGIRSISELGFHCQVLFGVAPGLWQPDEIHLFNTQRVNSYNSGKEITIIKPTHCSP